MIQKQKIHTCKCSSLCKVITQNICQYVPLPTIGVPYSASRWHCDLLTIVVLLYETGEKHVQNPAPGTKLKKSMNWGCDLMKLTVVIISSNTLLRTPGKVFATVASLWIRQWWNLITEFTSCTVAMKPFTLPVVDDAPSVQTWFQSCCNPFTQRYLSVTQNTSLLVAHSGSFLQKRKWLVIISPSMYQMLVISWAWPQISVDLLFLWENFLWD